MAVPSPARSENSAIYNVQDTSQLLDQASLLIRHATPVCSPNHDKTTIDNDIEEEEEDLIEKLISQLRSRGLNNAEIEKARRWDQPPVQESRDIYHLRELVEIAHHLSQDSTCTPIEQLRHAYIDAKQCRTPENWTTMVPDSPVRRAQNASNLVIREMQRQNFAPETFKFYLDVTRGGAETYEAVVQFCVIKLEELKRMR